MFTNSRIGYILLVALFLMSVISFLHLKEYSWTIYLATTFTFLFVVQSFLLILHSHLDPSLKRDILLLAGLLLMVVVSNILWVFVFPWCKYIASVSSLVFVFVLFTKLRDGHIRNKINEKQ